MGVDKPHCRAPLAEGLNFSRYSFLPKILGIIKISVTGWLIKKILSLYLTEIPQREQFYRKEFSI